MGMESAPQFHPEDPDFNKEGLEEERSLTTLTSPLVESLAMRGQTSLRLFESEILEGHNIPLEAIEKLNEDQARDFTREFLDPFFESEDPTQRGILATRAAEKLLKF